MYAWYGGATLLRPRCCHDHTVTRNILNLLELTQHPDPAPPDTALMRAPRKCFVCTRLVHTTSTAAAVHAHSRAIPSQHALNAALALAAAASAACAASAELECLMISRIRRQLPAWGIDDTYVLTIRAAQQVCNWLCALAGWKSRDARTKQKRQNRVTDRPAESRHTRKPTYLSPPQTPAPLPSPAPCFNSQLARPRARPAHVQDRLG